MQTITGYRDGTADANGVRFHYLEWGDAGSPPMVLLHGLTGHAHTWDHMAPQFAERYHVFALDERGHGDTSHPDTYTTQDFVDDLEAMREHWGLDRFILVGLSMGGHNSIAYATQHPERVSHAVIIDIPPRLDPPSWPNWAEVKKLAESGHPRFEDLEAAVAANRVGNPIAPDENLRYRTEWNLKPDGDGGLIHRHDHRVAAYWKPADLTDVLPGLSMPVLLARGGLTNVYPMNIARQMLEAIPDAELVQVDDSGHSIPTDRPEKLTPLILEWLKRRGG
jgi:pimeloyl-ACP methyl ester carboxylesterase